MFSMNDRLRRYRQDLLKHVERMEFGQVLKQTVRYPKEEIQVDHTEGWKLDKC
jgi:hypothetical protein